MTGRRNSLIEKYPEMAEKMASGDLDHLLGRNRNGTDLCAPCIVMFFGSLVSVEAAIAAGSVKTCADLCTHFAHSKTVCYEVCGTVGIGAVLAVLETSFYFEMNYIDWKMACEICWVLDLCVPCFE